MKQMTRTEINRASKKADTALVKTQDLFYGYNITTAIAVKVNQACDKLRELISEIESTEAIRNKK